MSLRRINAFRPSSPSPANNLNARPPSYYTAIASPPTYTPRRSARDIGTQLSRDVGTGTVDSAETSMGPRYGAFSFTCASNTITDTYVVYYRLYAEDGAIPTKTAGQLHDCDPYVGRIKAKAVAPPHTVASVKRCIAKQENFADLAGQRTVLFLTNSSQSCMDSTHKLSILDRTGPGSNPQEPLAVVILGILSESERKRIGAASVDCRKRGLETVGSSGGEIHYCESPRMLNVAALVSLLIKPTVHYHLYTEDGETPSRLSFDPEEPALGRLDANLVAPPLTAASIQRCIARFEKDSPFEQAKLYKNISSESPMLGDEYLNLSTTPGLSSEDPIILVLGPASRNSEGSGNTLVKARESTPLVSTPKTPPSSAEVIEEVYDDMLSSEYYLLWYANWSMYCKLFH